MEPIKGMTWTKVYEKAFDNLPESDAVYVIGTYTNGKHYVAIYTGQTNNIKRRSKEHWSDDEDNEKLKNIISNYRGSVSLFYSLDDKNALNGHERFLFNHYEPQAQSKAPDVEPKPISLPDGVSKGIIKEEFFNLKTE